MDRLLKRTRRVCPAAFCSRDFTCCKILLSPTKLQVFASYWSKKCYNPLSPRCSPDLSPSKYFLFPKFKIKLKGLHFSDIADIQRTVTGELKKVQKENDGVFAIFQWHNPSGRTMALGSTRPLTEMSTRCIFWG